MTHYGIIYTISVTLCILYVLIMYLNSVVCTVVVNTYNLNIGENELGSDSRQVPNIFMN